MIFLSTSLYSSRANRMEAAKENTGGGVGNITTLSRRSFEEEEATSCFGEARGRVSMSCNTQTPHQPRL